MDDRVAFICTDRRLVMQLVPDAYRVRKDRPLVWLQRACVWILDKLGAHHQVEVGSFIKVDISKDRLINQIFRQMTNLQFVYNYRPEQILVGAEDFQQMMDTPEIHNMVSFDVTGRIGENTKVMDLNIVVIPWMRGIVVMPKL